MQVSATRVRVTRKIGFLNRAITFRLDDEVTSQDASAQLVVVGWAVHSSKQISRVELRAGNERLQTTALDVYRPGVRDRFPSSPNAELSGFRLEIPAPSQRELQLYAFMESGRQVLLATLELVQTTEPRLLFMHIPKAAGSSVNQYFSQHFANDRQAVHIESDENWQKDPDRIRKLDFVSGHVTLPRLASKLNIEDYLLVTVIREPFAQVVSHLAWVRRLADAGEEIRLASHPPYIQSFAKKLASFDLASPNGITQMIEALEESENRLVENCQTRYFTQVEPGRKVTGDDRLGAFEASKSFDLIGSTGDINGFLCQVASRMGWAPPAKPPSQNVSAGYYGLDPNSDAHRAALLPLVQHDLDLYQAIVEARSSR